MLPAKKTSKSRTRTRRAHHALTVPGYVDCPNCGQPKRAHAACGSCGHYSSKIKVGKSKE